MVTAAAGAISVLFSWYYQPYFPAGSQALYVSKELPIGSSSPFAPGLFDLRGVTFAAWTLAAFAIGVLAGVLIRRVVPAIVATLVVYAGLAFAVGGFLRQHYLAPLVTSKLNIPDFRVGHQPAVVHQRAAGRRARSALNQVLQRAPADLAGKGGVPKSLTRVAIPRPARVHAVDHLPAGQPVLAIPVDRGRLAARPVGAAHRRDRLAGPAPRGLTLMSRARVGRQQLDRDGSTSFADQADLGAEPGHVRGASPSRRPMAAAADHPVARFGVPAAWAAAAALGGAPTAVAPARAVTAPVRAHPRGRRGRDHPGGDPAQGVREHRLLPGAERGHPCRLERRPSASWPSPRARSGTAPNPSNSYCNKFSAYWDAGTAGCPSGEKAEEWCADFAAWAWQQAGVQFTYGYGPGEINGAAVSFYEWGVANGEWHPATSGYVAVARRRGGLRSLARGRPVGRARGDRHRRRARPAGPGRGERGRRQDRLLRRRDRDRPGDGRRR